MYQLEKTYVINKTITIPQKSLHNQMKPHKNRSLALFDTFLFFYFSTLVVFVHVSIQNPYPNKTNETQHTNLKLKLHKKKKQNVTYTFYCCVTLKQLLFALLFQSHYTAVADSARCLHSVCVCVRVNKQQTHQNIFYTKRCTAVLVLFSSKCNLHHQRSAIKTSSKSYTTVINWSIKLHKKKYQPTILNPFL